MSTTRKRVYVAGHRGLVGSAIVRALAAQSDVTVITRTRAELDLLNEHAVADFFASERPDIVYLAAARVGGIMANSTMPVEFLVENLKIQNNVISCAYKHNAQKLMFLGSSCIYPKDCAQPIKEEYLLTGPLEPTNEPYAIAKIAGITLCNAYRHEYGANFISVMPTNMYGPNDNFDLQTSHVLPALMRKIHTAKVNGSDSVVIWGSGKPRREFLYSDDLASACVYLMDHYDGPDILNIGTGSDVSILELARLIADIVEYDGEIVFDSTKPDGTFRKLLDVSKLAATGWRHTVELREGVSRVYDSADKSGWN